MPLHEFLMAHMNFGAHPFKTREATAKIAVSGSSRCTWNCIFKHSEAHPGLVRARNTNLCALASENMWYPHILIQLLAVQILLQPHSSRLFTTLWNHGENLWESFVMPLFVRSTVCSSVLVLKMRCSAAAAVHKSWPPWLCSRNPSPPPVSLIFSKNLL